MSSQDAAAKGVTRYTLAVARGADKTEAYIKGLDFIIDTLFKGRDFLEPQVMRAIGTYEKRLGF